MADESLLHDGVANSRSCFGRLLGSHRTQKDPVCSMLVSRHVNTVVTSEICGHLVFFIYCIYR